MSAVDTDRGAQRELDAEPDRDDAPERAADARNRDGRDAGPGPARRALTLVRRYAGVPAFVAAAGAANWLWLASRDLGVSEQRFLNADFVRRSLVQHVELSALATVLVLVIAIPLGIALTRPWARPITPYAVAVANLGLGVPSIGVLVVVFLLNRDPVPAAIVGLALYSLLPVLRGTMVGLEQVDRSVIKAATGMGMSRLDVLRRIELPLAVPITLTGIRTTLVLVVSTVPLAAFVGAGGLGDIIRGGFGLSRPTLVITGSVLCAGLALLADWLGGIVEDLLRPRGL